MDAQRQLRITWPAAAASRQKRRELASCSSQRATLVLGFLGFNFFFIIVSGDVSVPPPSLYFFL